MSRPAGPLGGTAGEGDAVAWLWWLGAALVLAIAEELSLGLVLLMFSGGALAAAITAGLGAPVVVQVINLLTTPEQAEQLSLAASQTQIQLVLRNPLDRVAVNTPGTTLTQIFSGRRAPMPNVSEDQPSQPRQRVAPRPVPMPVVQAAPPKKEAPFVMEIISGTKKTENKFAAENNGEGK